MKNSSQVKLSEPQELTTIVNVSQLKKGDTFISFGLKYTCLKGAYPDASVSVLDTNENHFNLQFVNKSDRVVLINNN